MGVNISIVDRSTNKDVEGWDFLRHSGDRDVIHILSSIPHTAYVDEETLLRPQDVQQFRAALHAALACNTARWDQMCDLLADDENRALYFSW